MFKTSSSYRRKRRLNLRHNVPDPSSESCPTKIVLLTEWQLAAEAYSKTVAELTHRIGVLSKDEYERLKGLAENAHSRSVEAQARLEAHIREHECGNNIDAVA
jgi:uncharacterized small protein (DUF1192 family)